MLSLLRPFTSEEADSALRNRKLQEIKRILALDREELDRVGAAFELPPADQELRPAKKTEETGKLSQFPFSPCFTA